MPLFLIFGIQNLCAFVCKFSAKKNENLFLSLTDQSKHFYFNAGMFTTWLILTTAGIIGIIHFRKNFLKSKTLSKQTIILTKAENITADYYFTYFSLFVISFFDVDPTDLKDVLIFSSILIAIILVYIVNEMYFVNPILNILGYKSFAIAYEKNIRDSDQNKNLKSFEIKVFSKYHLNRMVGEKLFVTFSPHNFSICYPIDKKNSIKTE